MRFLQLDEADLDNLTQIANLHDDLVFKIIRNYGCYTNTTNTYSD